MGSANTWTPGQRAPPAERTWEAGRPIWSNWGPRAEGSLRREKHEVRRVHSVFAQLAVVSIPSGAHGFTCSTENVRVAQRKGVRREFTLRTPVSPLTVGDGCGTRAAPRDRPPRRSYSAVRPERDSAPAAAPSPAAAGRTAPARRAAAAGVTARVAAGVPARVAGTGVARAGVARPPAASAVGRTASGTPASGAGPPLPPGLRRTGRLRPPDGQQPSDDDHGGHCRDEDTHVPHRLSSPEARSPVASPSMCERGIPQPLACQSGLEQLQSLGPGWRP